MGNLYSGWLPEHLYYTFHLLAWMLPVLLIQWVVGPRILWRNRRPILLAVFIVGTYLILTDIVAVYYGVWFFDENLILGWSPFGVPIEEWAFFYLTALLVAQSFVLFLPDRYRQ